MIEADSLIDAWDEGTFIVFRAWFEDDNAAAEKCEAVPGCGADRIRAIDIGGDEGVGSDEKRVIS